MAKIHIIVGSVNGRALETATAVAHVLSRQGHVTQLNTEPHIGDIETDTEAALLVCCSTTGNGELPAGLHSLYMALDDRVLNLDGRPYGIIALGDSGYQHFARAGYMMEGALYAAGGRLFGEICTLDARTTSNHPLSAALWANEWASSLPQV